MLRAEVGAKVNLSLAVTGRRGAMHTLDMRVCGIALCDVASVAEGEGERFEWLAEPYGFKRERFLPRLESAYERLSAYFGTSLRFKLEKHIPSGAGLGGSSALAAAMTLLFEARTGIKASDDLLLSLGSDVPYMYRGGEARVTGCGERVESLPYVPRSVLVVFPEGGVDTAAAYALYDRTAQKDCGAVKGEYFNDLYLPATVLNPDVARVKALVESCGARNVVMTGSGSAVCAFFGEEEEESAREVYRRASERVRSVLVRTMPQNRVF